MDIKIKIHIADADAGALGTALQMARAIELANGTAPADGPLFQDASATISPKSKSKKTTKKTAPKPEAQAQPQPQAQAQTQPDPANEEPAPAPAPAPEPEAEPAKAAASVPEPAESGITLEALRKRFTDISKEHPGARQKVSEILISRNAKSLPTLPEDQYESALEELEAWVKEQAS